MFDEAMKLLYIAVCWIFIEGRPGNDQPTAQAVSLQVGMILQFVDSLILLQPLLLQLLQPCTYTCTYMISR